MKDDQPLFYAGSWWTLSRTKDYFWRLKYDPFARIEFFTLGDGSSRKLSSS